MHSHITPHNFIDGTDGFERVKSSEDIFIPIRSKFSRHDTMNGYVPYESSVIFTYSPGIESDDDWWGCGLFEVTQPPQ